MQLLTVLTGILLYTFSYAYNINPINRLSPLPFYDNFDYVLAKAREPVHEHMTLLALDCHPNPEGCIGSDIDVNRIRTKRNTAPLLDGVEWNDDPGRMLLTNLKTAIQWVYWMDDAKKKAKCELKSNTGSCILINEEYDLLYRTHYGDLQFLHAMAAQTGEHPTITLQKMIDWAEFTYKVSTGEIKANDKLEELESNGKSNVNYYIKRGSWSVGYLFTKKENYLDRNVKLLALGSLLHMIQDSFSDAHVERINSCNPLNHNKTAVLKFHDYSNQEPLDHNRADITP